MVAVSKSRIRRFSDDKQPVVDEWMIDDELQFDSSEVLGTGHFSTVFKGALKKRQPAGCGKENVRSSVVVAVEVPNEGPNTASDVIWREIQRHKELKTHVHVVQMIGYKAVNSLRPVIVFEYCSEGDLLKWLHRQQRFQSDVRTFDFATYLKQQISIAWQASDGMIFVSSRGIVHRDLAARNMLLAEGLVVKIGDFGLARNASDNVYPNKTFGRLPVKRMAPESLRSGSFSTKSDVHSLAQDCCVLEPESRPTFHKVRDLLACFLEKTVALDGYLSFGTQLKTTTGLNDDSATHDAMTD